MNRMFLLALSFLLSFNSYAQYGFDRERDQETGQTIFKGRCTFDDLSDEASFDWLTLNSSAYSPDPATTEELKKALPACELIIFMGTWCEDTHMLLPKLYKTMLLSRCFTNYKMYGVDRDKKSNKDEQAQYDIVNVPTIIVMKNGKELGRIVESTKENIEKDLLHIVAVK